MYRRFAHAGPKKLRSLHRVTTLAELISVVYNYKCPYKVCALIKIKNRRGHVTRRKISILDLISIDVYSLLPVLRKKEVYFLLIIDNYLRRH